jgi:hypothetical protein
MRMFAHRGEPELVGPVLGVFEISRRPSPETFQAINFVEWEECNPVADVGRDPALKHTWSLTDNVILFSSSMQPGIFAEANEKPRVGPFPIPVSKISCINHMRYEFDVSFYWDRGCRG